MRKKVDCDVCGKSFSHGNSGNLIGTSLELKAICEVDRDTATNMRKQLGPYYKGESTRYEICFECWLRSLGVEPPKMNESFAWQEIPLEPIDD